jgi:hypothetical protein
VKGVEVFSALSPSRKPITLTLRQKNGTGGDFTGGVMVELFCLLFLASNPNKKYLGHKGVPLGAFGHS